MPFGGDRNPFGYPNSDFDGRYNVTGDIDKKDDGEESDDDEEKSFKMFESSPRYGKLRNLMFSDNTRKLAEIDVDEMSYKVGGIFK